MDGLDSAEANSFSLFDASDDDFLLASSAGEANAIDNPGDVFDKGMLMDKLSDMLPLPKPRKTGKCNLRKSLAWDSAFFTSAGVLDAEELSSIIEGTETGAKSNQSLPGIQEDLSKSTDSISTFESDSLTLESLEADLFRDVRASIQRSSKPSALGDSSGAIFHGKGESKNGCSKMTAEASSCNMVKLKLPLRKPSPAEQGSGKISKPGLICKQVTRPPAKIRESSSSIARPPTLTSKKGIEAAATSKRMSVGRAKLNNNAAGNIKDPKGAGLGALVPKGPHQADSRTTLLRAPVTSKLPSASSVGNRSAVRNSRSSCDISSSSSSENIRKSQADITRRKIDKNVNLPAGSKVRTPSRVPVKNKSQLGESRLSVYVKSTSNLSPSISPASSMSEWSTESSSSTATANQKHGQKVFPTTESIVNSSIFQSQGELSIDKTSDGHDNKVTSVLSHSLKQPLTVSDPSLGHPGAAKPSGLKLPSPKIGFFDGMKCGSKTPSGNVRPRSAFSSGLPRSGSGTCSPCGPPNRAKLGNTASKIKMTAAGTLKTDPPRSSASAKPNQLVQDHSAGLPKPLSVGSMSEASEAPKGVSGESLLGRYAEAAEKAGAEEQIAGSISGKDLRRSGLGRICGPSASDKLDVSTEADGNPETDSQSIDVSTEPTEVVQEHLVSLPKPSSEIKVDNFSGEEKTEAPGTTDSQSVDVSTEPTEVVQEHSVSLPKPSSEIKVDNFFGEEKTAAPGTPKTDSQSINVVTEPTEVVHEHSVGLPKPPSQIEVDNSFGEVKITAAGTYKIDFQSISASTEPVEVVQEHSGGLPKPSIELTVDNSSGKVKTTAAGTLETDLQSTSGCTESTEVVQESSVGLPKPLSEVTADNYSAKVEKPGAGTPETDSQSTSASPEPTEAVLEHSVGLPEPSGEFKVVINSGTQLEVPECISSQPLMESTVEVAEKAGAGELITDFVSDKELSADLPKHSILTTPDNFSDGVSEFQNVSSNSDSAVLTQCEFTEGADIGTRPESLVANNNSPGLPMVCSAKKLDDEGVPELPTSTPPVSCFKYYSKGVEVQSGVADFNSMAMDNSLGLASPVKNLHDNSVSSSELPTSTPSNPSSEHNINFIQATDGGEDANYCGMVVKYDSNVSEKEGSTEGKMQLPIGSVTNFAANTDDRADCLYRSCFSPSAEVGHSNRSNGSTTGNPNSFHEGNVALHASVGGQDSGKESVESKQNIYTKSQEETPDHKIQQSESILEQSETISSFAKESCNKNDPAKYESLVPCSLPSSALAVSPESSTPFAVKNFVSDVVEACKPFAGSTVEPSVQIDVISFLEKDPKE